MGSFHGEGWGDEDGSALKPPFDAAPNPAQQTDLDKVLEDNPGVFSDHPGCTPLMTHAIHTPPGQVARA